MNTKKLSAFFISVLLCLACALQELSVAIGAGETWMVIDSVEVEPAPPYQTWEGIVEVEHWRDGVMLQRDTAHNIVTNTGKAAIAGLLNGVVTNFFEYIAIGTSNTAAAATQTACQAEITTGGGERKIGTTSRVTTTVTNDTAQIEATFTFSLSFSVNEACLLDSSSSGIMFARRVIGPYSVVSGDSLIVRWKLQNA